MRDGETSALTRVFSWLWISKFAFLFFFGFLRGTEEIRKSGELWRRRVLGIRSFLGGRLRRGFRGGLLMLGELDFFGGGFGGGGVRWGWGFLFGEWGLGWRGGGCFCDGVYS